MSESSSMLLLGIGGAGAAIARGVERAYGGGLRLLLVDTDAASNTGDAPFALVGGGRLAGRGAGGDIVAARLAAEESVQVLDEHLEGIRLAVVVTALGGGTGGGTTLETIKHLGERGIPSLVFATTPFTFEGEDRQRNARGIMSMIEDAANATFFLPLDKLIADTDNMDEALKRAVDTLASGITLFWRMVEKPGYIRMDVERIRRLLRNAGRGRFATATVQGPDRAREAVDRICRSPLLAVGTNPVRAIVCGVLAGEDLRLSELAVVSESVQASFGGERRSFDLATVNDEQTFTGRLALVVMLFESNGKDEPPPDQPGGFGRKRKRNAAAAVGTTGHNRFSNAEPTVWNGEDLDVPTFLRQGISLDF